MDVSGVVDGVAAFGGVTTGGPLLGAGLTAGGAGVSGIEVGTSGGSVDSTPPATRGGSGSVGGAVFSAETGAGRDCGAGGVNTAGDLRNKHEPVPIDRLRISVRALPELSRKLGMSDQSGEQKTERSPQAVFAREIDSTIMQLDGPVSHR